MFLKISLGIIAIIAVIVVYAAFQPPEYVITRTQSIKSPISKIFPYLQNSKLYEKWSPWSESDPNAVMKYEGPEEGVGAITSWDSSGRLGKGSATIIEVEQDRKVRIKIDYSRPMEMTQISDYIVENKGEETLVTWRVEGMNNLISRIMCLFVNVDKMVGDQFEKGLLKLKAAVE